MNKIPYFEVKVVKIKKEKKKEYIPFKCEGCREVIKGCKGLENERQRIRGGNWVNGENIDKIKFPCLCSFLIYDKRVYGELDYVGHNRELLYLKDLVGQNCDERYYTQFPICNLDKIIKEKNIHILKGKIVIFEV